MKQEKNKDDKISKEFYYLGRMTATGRAKEFTMPNTDKTGRSIRRRNMTYNRKRRKIVKGIVLISVIGLISVCVFYLGDYYHADEEVIATFESDALIAVTELENGDLVFEPKSAKTGLIFYPGGKVEYTSYIPLMKACAEQGILCVLVEMPFNLAVFDVNAADGIIEEYPEIEEWYIGGHSLGGSMAASYLENHADDYEGLILLGSYSTVDFSDSDLNVLSIYGSEDQVLNKEKYDEYKSNLPEDYTEVVIDGGCHAFFGVYGKQDGDGIPTISNEEQIQMTTTEIAMFVGNRSVD